MKHIRKTKITKILLMQTSFNQYDKKRKEIVMGRKATRTIKRGK